MLITPRNYSSLPQLKFPNGTANFPSKNDVIKYLELYANKFQANIRFNCQVLSVTKEKDYFVLQTAQGDFVASQVVIASGYSQKPYIPDFADYLSPAVQQLHSSNYKNPASVRQGTVLVVGSGNSGISIASELAKDRPTYLAQGNVKHFPRKLLGKDIFEWADALGLLNLTRNTRLGELIAQKMIKSGDATYGIFPVKVAKAHGFRLMERAVSAAQDYLVFQDGSHLSVNAVVWATGFKPDYQSWIHFSIFDSNGIPHHNRGCTAIDGLYFLGLKWQTRITSFLLHGVGSDAAHLATKISQYALQTRYGSI